jgi:excisionase family DNA binding protein
MLSPSDRLLRIAEVAAFTQRSTRSVRRWIKSGRLRATRAGGSVWILESELLRFLGMPPSPDAETDRNEA